MKKQIVITVLLLFVSISAMAQKTEHRNLEKKLAIEGYDPVAYFKSGKPVKGKKELALNYDGAVYYFSSETNKTLFKQNPADYMPQYGGWCAFAMGDYGEKVEINPETFKIVDGKLYLFYNKLFTNTLKSWNNDETSLKKKADTNWKKIIN
ncbi:YHS domain-containing protein [Flavobacterium salilacus subsp. salilacus]|uniref:YHS domain-containing (seleno)protein n=1 Tax=Flavobacterium TaxID=237 RepID=UPI001074D979|nr:MULTISPECIES: YHS domain-containing (seleno)protein [Flavobacterium]KAF2517560.1 YHS domain-containing protein [Flavobacterium salilacus subsp. salilacus]MBE1615709.1 YHS domain-containing protein [Flavobacterium sp. SaA2.13]